MPNITPAFSKLTWNAKDVLFGTGKIAITGKGTIKRLATGIFEVVKSGNKPVQVKTLTEAERVLE